MHQVAPVLAVVPAMVPVEMAEVPTASKLHKESVKDMVMNIANAVNGARIAEVRIPQGTR